jgi:hypothetical protein
MITPFVLEGIVTSEHPNQSLPGLVFRLGTHSPSFLDTQGEPLHYDNLAALAPRQAGWIIKGCMALFAVLILWSCRTPVGGARASRPQEQRPAAGTAALPFASRQRWRLAAEFSLVILGMLLFSERTWKHHGVTLLLPFAVLTYYLAVCRPRIPLRIYLVASLAVTVLLMTSTSTTGVSEVLDEAAKKAQVYGAYVWAYLVLVAALAVLLRCTEAEPQLQIADYRLQNEKTPFRLQSEEYSGCRVSFHVGDRGEASAHGVLGDRSG